MKYYLATTGISDIWDLNREIVLLGPWCLINKNNKELLTNRNYFTVPSPWQPAYKIKQAADDCQRMYEESLPLIADRLNLIHNLNYPIKYWRVLLGPWLLYFIGQIYSRYTRAKNAINHYPDFYTHVIPKDQCKLQSLDTIESIVYKANDDFHNLKIFSIICRILFPQHCVSTDISQQNTHYGCQESGQKRFLNILKSHKNLFFKGDIVLYDLYHISLIDKFRLVVASRFKGIRLVFLKSLGKIILKFNFSGIMRNNLIIRSSDQFKALLYEMIADAMPMCYVENFSYYQDYAKRCLRGDISVVGSMGGWFFDESFKFFAAEASLNGAKLIDFQHGGGYGLSLAIPAEVISKEKDIFYSWGWREKNKHNVMPLTNIYLSRLKNTYKAKTDKVLFIGASFLKYDYKFENAHFPEGVENYFNDKKIFFHSLSKSIRDKVIYRPQQEIGWEERKYILGFFPEMDFLEMEKKLVPWLRKVKLVVIDHPHTSYIEALTINVPSIFFWDHDVYLMRPEAEEYFQLLRDVGIVYKNPEDAAKKVNEIYDDPLKWWCQSEIQNARMRFCDTFAFTSNEWPKEWAGALKSLK